MKAILTKTLFATDYKPTRIKVQAEGVPHIVVSKGLLEITLKEKGERETEEALHQAAARILCRRYEWGTSLVSGGLPTPGQWVHCFTPQEETVRVNRELLDAAEELLRFAPHGSITHRECNTVIARAKSSGHKFLRGQDLVVAQAKILLAEGYANLPHGKTAVSSYHLNLLVRACEDLA